MPPSGQHRAFLALPSKATADDLKQHFSKFGEVVDVYLPIDKATGKSKGIAFITFEVLFCDLAKEIICMDACAPTTFSSPQKADLPPERQHVVLSDCKQRCRTTNTQREILILKSTVKARTLLGLRVAIIVYSCTITITRLVGAYHAKLHPETPP